MTDTNLTSGQAESELRKKIQVLERSLQQELCARSALEVELYQIKNSLAWTLLVRYRLARNRLLAEDTRRRVCYEIVRDIFKAVVLFRGRNPQARGSSMPTLAAGDFESCERRA